jgi:para-nitrobenzyl esterase
VRAARRQVVRDQVFFCSTRRAARAAVAAGQPAWVYRFDFPIPSLEYDLFGDYHSAEVQYVFGNSAAAGSAESAYMQSYWTNFVKTGDPNNGGGTPLAWPAYDAAGDAVLILGATTSVATGISSAACDFWDASNAVANHLV